MSEAYQELDPATRDRAIAVFTEWAARQPDQRRPFLEFLDGSTLTPEDLLAELPPTETARPYSERSARWNLRLLLRVRKPRAWIHVLNLVAVSALRGDDDVDELLNEIAGSEEAEGSAGMTRLS